MGEGCVAINFGDVSWSRVTIRSGAVALTVKEGSRSVSKPYSYEEPSLTVGLLPVNKTIH